MLVDDLLGPKKKACGTCADHAIWTASGLVRTRFERGIGLGLLRYGFPIAGLATPSMIRLPIGRYGLCPRHGKDVWLFSRSAMALPVQSR
jgi:hypothetical protein